MARAAATAAATVDAVVGGRGNGARVLTLRSSFDLPAPRSCSARQSVSPHRDLRLSRAASGEGRASSEDDGGNRTSWFIAVLRTVRAGMLLGRGLFTVRRLSATTPSTHREAQVQEWACAVLQALGIQVRLQAATQPGLLQVADQVSWPGVIVLHSLCPRVRCIAMAVVSAVTSVLGSGGTMMVFPEGTTTDSLAVLPSAPASFRRRSPEAARRSRSPCAIPREHIPSAHLLRNILCKSLT
jgi:hypothetical protein